MDVHNLDLQSLIGAIRKGLEEVDSDLKSRSREALFDLESMELELKFVVSESDTLKGGFDLKVVSLGASSGIKSDTVQTVRLTYSLSKSAAAGLVPGARAHSASGTRGATDVKRLKK